jgi:hypothetical protein
VVELAASQLQPAMSLREGSEQLVAQRDDALSALRVRVSRSARIEVRRSAGVLQVTVIF